MDDTKTINFFVSHVADDETMPFEKRRELEMFGQHGGRPYHDRQYIPGDYDAQVSQGPINVFALEHLGTHDRGIVMFRRYLRQNIKAVEGGKDPAGFYMSAEAVPPTFSNDAVVPISEVEGSPEDPRAVIAAAERIGRGYLSRPPMGILRGEC